MRRASEVIGGPFRVPPTRLIRLFARLVGKPFHFRGMIEDFFPVKTFDVIGRIPELLLQNFPVVFSQEGGSPRIEAEQENSSGVPYMCMGPRKG